jgi:hypothetical protein
MGTATIGVVIGLVLAYSLLSLIVSQINNLIIYILKYRTGFLVERMKVILPDLADEILKNPLINVTDKAGNWMRVDTIKTDHVVKVLLKILEDSQTDDDINPQSVVPVHQLLNDILGEKEFRNLRNMLKAAKNLPASRQFLESLDKGKEAIEAVQEYERLIRGKLDESKLAVQSWVDARFTDMSNLYKQYMYVLSLFVGLVLAVVLNVDTLHMGQTLWNEPTLREAVLESANQISESELRPSTLDDNYDEQVASIQASIELLLNSNLPIGWVNNPLDPNPEVSAQGVQALTQQSYDPRKDLRNVANILAFDFQFIAIKIVGWLLTAFALSLGTDFWFNLLRQVTGRSGGAPPRESA